MAQPTKPNKEVVGVEMALASQKKPNPENASALQQSYSVVLDKLDGLREQNKAALDLTMKAKQTLAEAAQKNLKLTTLTKDPQMVKSVQEQFAQVLQELKEVTAKQQKINDVIEDVQNKSGPRR